MSGTLSDEHDKLVFPRLEDHQFVVQEVHLAKGKLDFGDGFVVVVESARKHEDASCGCASTALKIGRKTSA